MPAMASPPKNMVLPIVENDTSGGFRRSSALVPYFNVNP